MAKRLFNRSCKVTVSQEGNSGITIDEAFRIQFQLTKTLSAEANAADVAIYNLSRETQQKLMEAGDFLQVEAGYDGFTEILTLGEITRIYVSQELPDSILRIEAGDGVRVLKQRKINLSFEEGVTGQRILDALLQEIRVSKTPRAPALRKIYQQGFSYSGNVFDLLTLLTRREGFFWSLQNGQLLILDVANPQTREAVVLSEKTGLIGSPERLEDFGLETNRVSGSGWSVRSLLNPKLQPGNGLILESKIVKGEFLIDTINFLGDTRGNDWVSEIEVYG